ncbi:MAG: hypothetical protein ACOC2L_00940 [Candidatus Sumerlaeota bacterium]
MKQWFRRNRLSGLFLAVALAFGVLLAGCDGGAEDDMEDAGDNIEEAAEEMGDATEESAEEAEDTMEEATN